MRSLFSWADAKGVLGAAMFITALDRATGTWWCGLTVMAGMILFLHAREGR